jgi:hypothetical protein
MVHFQDLPANKRVLLQARPFKKIIIVKVNNNINNNSNINKYYTKQQQDIYKFLEIIIQVTYERLS